ncbi:MAG: MOSC domain-containing protein [Gemmatimonadetes bacterium]|nr:MOSC domain-containing protein [Gemmatimonadota bacterium]
MITVTALHLYPLKGARGISVDSIALDRFGPQGDRRWLLVDADGCQITQRDVPRLCLIEATPSAKGIRLSAPNLQSIEVAPPEGAARRPVRVWDDIIPAAPTSAEADAWASEALGRSCHLVHCPDDSPRRTSPEYDPIGSPVSFADGYPILVIGEASLADLNRRLAAPLPMNRFRPNVVVRGAEPFAEDGWRRFRMGPIVFDAVKPCARCTVPTTNQATAERGPEPLRTLATFRKRGSAVLFGMNVVHRAAGTLRVGDTVEIPPTA